MQAAPRRALTPRVTIVLLGSFVSSFGYLLTVQAEVGNGPMFAVQDALHLRTGMPLALAAVLAGLSLAGLARALGVRLGVGPVAIPLLTGATVALLEPFVPHVEGVGWRWASFAAGTVVMMLGAVVMFRAGFGGSALESAMFGVARVTRTDVARARIALEGVMALLGLTFGGRVGPGTALMAVSVGPLFVFWDSRLPGRGPLPADRSPGAQPPRRRASAISLAASRSD